MLPRLSTLVLDSADLSAGDKSNDLTELSFRNIDFDTLIGEDWREFDQFNMVLTSVVFDVIDTLPDTSVPEVRLSGPPFTNPDMRSDTTYDNITLCSVDLTSITTKPYIQYFHSTNAWTLNRDDENLFNFTIRLVDPTTGSVASGEFPRQLYIFKIYRL